MPVILALGTLRQEDYHEFKPHLTYRMISTVAWDTEKDLVRIKK